MVATIAFRILGSPQSKSNSRQIVTIAGRPTPIKSKEALAYERDALRQIPSWARQRLEGPVFVRMKIYYVSERSDLDESLVLDCLQDRYAKSTTSGRVLIQPGVYRNDRQVRLRLIAHGIDAANPRAEIYVEPLQAQEGDLFAQDIGTMLKPLEDQLPF